MRAPEEIEPDPQLARLIGEFATCGGVLDFVFLRFAASEPPESLHRSVALTGMAVIAQRYDQRWTTLITASFPTASVVPLTWDAARLTGEPITSDTFLATSGYREAFFNPPYDLNGNRSWQEYEELFAQINSFILGPNPLACEIFSWGTDWASYFNAGNEWWGAYYWTFRQPGSDIFAVIGASTSD